MPLGSGRDLSAPATSPLPQLGSLLYQEAQVLNATIGCHFDGISALLSFSYLLPVLPYTIFNIPVLDLSTGWL